MAPKADETPVETPEVPTVPDAGGDPASPGTAGDTVTKQDETDQPEVAGLCPECFPFGAPEGYSTFGCAHGQWSVEA